MLVLRCSLSPPRAAWTTSSPCSSTSQASASAWPPQAPRYAGAWPYCLAPGSHCGIRRQLRRDVYPATCTAPCFRGQPAGAGRHTPPPLADTPSCPPTLLGVLQPGEVIETPATGCLHPSHRGYFSSPAEYMRWYEREGPVRDPSAPTGECRAVHQSRRRAGWANAARAAAVVAASPAGHAHLRTQSLWPALHPATARALPLPAAPPNPRFLLPRQRPAPAPWFPCRALPAPQSACCCTAST